MGIAGRAVDIQTEIDALKTNSDISEEERLKKLNALNQELSLARTIASAEDIKLATIEKQKSQTQLMIDEIRKKQIELDTEIFKTKALITEKQNALIAEEQAYKELARTRVNLENQYYDLFKSNIN